MFDQDSFLASNWIRLITFGFRLLYNELAWTYDIVSWLVSLGHWRQWQVSALPFISGQVVLELAHGPGHMLLELERNGYDVVGIDLSPSMTRIASSRLRRNNSAATILRAKAQQMPFISSSFDSVLATFPTTFILDPATLEQLHRVTRPDGRVVIVPQARLSGGGLMIRFLEWLYTITGQKPVPEENQLASPNWLIARQLFEEAGFKLDIINVDLGKSTVTIVIATKNSEKLTSSAK